MSIQPPRLDLAQSTAIGDMPPTELRAALHEAAELVADYLEGVEDYAVLPDIEPGDVSARLDRPPPEDPEPFASIMRDVRSDLVPNVTHWQHPGYLAYFASSASGIGIVGELVMSGLNSNAFLWRTNPAAAELEAITVRWLREGLGLPEAFDGLYNDTASTSSLAALAGARQQAMAGASQRGLGEAPRLRFYTSAESHASIDRAAMILGLGREGSRRIDTDHAYAMEPDALVRAIHEDREAGYVPAAVTATIGTTGSTAIDPVERIADICAEESLWLHVDAAYAGPVALIPERRAAFAGWERADSIVINPHKWLFTPVDCSLLLTRRMETLREALSLVPEYLRTVGGDTTGRDYSEYTPQLGRRGRSIKMWLLLRYFGLSGLRARIEAHIELAGLLAAWVDAEVDAERLAPTPFSTVCFRWRPARFAGREREPDVARILDALNETLMARLNDTGAFFISHTRLEDRFTLRIAIGNIRTEPRHLERAWDLIRMIGRELDSAIA